MTIFDPKECTKPPRADMFLPDFLLYFGIFLGLCAVALLAVAFTMQLWWLILCALLAGVLGAAAWLCWKNQTITMIDSNHFTYTTFLGKTTEYRFSDIQEYRVNQDSMTIILKNGKVHIESMVCMSKQLLMKLEEHIANQEHTS